MRISDWSSDVCSSDLNPVGGDLPRISVPLLDEGRPTAFMIFTRKLDRICESLQPHLLPPFGRDLEVLDAPTHFFTGQDARAVFFLRRAHGFDRKHGIHDAAIVTNLAAVVLLRPPFIAGIHLTADILNRPKVGHSAERS